MYQILGSISRWRSFRSYTVSLILIVCFLLTGLGYLKQQQTVEIAQADIKVATLDPGDIVLNQNEQLPLMFEENQGQVDDQVKYSIKTGDNTIFFTPEGVVYKFFKGKQRPEAAVFKGEHENNNEEVKGEGVVVKQSFLGAVDVPLIRGEETLESRVNYFLGNDADEWHTNVKTYKSIRYSSLYNGVDLVYKGTNGQLKYEYQLQPGIDYHQIKVQFEGIEELQIDEAGNLVIVTSIGNVRIDKPFAYQVVNGEIKEIKSYYALYSSQIYGFELEDYDQSLPLIIDPTLDYSTFAGAVDGIIRHSYIKVDTTGNVYLFGMIYSGTFPTTPGAYDVTVSGTRDCLLQKINPTATTIVFATYLGTSSNSDGCSSLAIDSSNNVYVSGKAAAADFPTTPGAYDTTFSGTGAGFITKFNSTGTALIFSTYIDCVGGPCGAVTNIDLDGSNNIVFTFSAGVGFPTTAGVYQPANAGSWDVVVGKLNAAGTNLLLATYIGGLDGDNLDRMVVDVSGNIYITGRSEINFPTTPGSFDPTFNGGIYDIFVSKLDPTMTTLLYSGWLGTSSTEEGPAPIAVDLTGNLYIAGRTNAADWPTTVGAFDETINGSYDGYVTKISADGSSLVYSTYIGGAAVDNIRGLVVDAMGNAYGTGYSYSNDFPITPDATDDLHDDTNGDAIVFKLNAAGDSLDFATYLGGDTKFDGGWALAIDASDNLYVIGQTQSSDFTTTPGVFATTLLAVADAFITKYSFAAATEEKTSLFFRIQQQVEESPMVEQEPEEIEEIVPETPSIGDAVVLGPNSISYYWIDQSINEDGFRLLDEFGNVLIDIPQAGVTSVDEVDLLHNTLIGIRKVVSYNTAGQSIASGEYDRVVTAMPDVSPALISLSDNSVAFGIENSLNNLALGESGIEFELLLPDTSTSAATVISSGWVQSATYTFNNVDVSNGGAYRSRARNQAGLVTDWSIFINLGSSIVEDRIIEEEIIEAKLPVELPTEEETEIIEELLTEFYEEEIAEILGEEAPPEEGEPGVEIETISSYDGESFTIEVTKEQAGEIEEKLTITGFATSGEGIIEFSGSTSQPNSVVTLIFNGDVTIIVVSDANGSWATYVSAEQLGIKPGQEANVSIEAIAAKGDLRSDRVQVGSIFISRASAGEIEVDFLTVVSESAVITAINEVVQEVAIVIEEQEEEIQTTLTIAAPVVIVSSAPLWGYLPYLPTLIYHFFTYLIGFIGRRKQKGERLYGVAYDSITKEPLGLAIIRVYRSMSAEKLIATKVTDKQGRYDLLLEPGNYRIEVKKPGYSFPSAIVTGQVDGDYDNIYTVETQNLASLEDGQVIIPDVPLDPENAQKTFEIAGVIKKAWLTLQKAGSHIAVPILIVGSLISVAVVVTIPENPTNWILAALYILMLILQLKLRPKMVKAWGVVYDVATNAVLPLTTIQLIDPEYGKVVTSRLSDYQGRFAFLPDPGSYVLKATKEGYQQTEVVEAPEGRTPVAEQVEIVKLNQRIVGDVGMRASRSPEGGGGKAGEVS